MASPPTNQGLLALVVMLIVLAFIVAYCCWGACCRLLGRRGIDGLVSQFPDPPLGFSQPAVVLLPYGRMVLVDSELLDQLSESDLLALLDPANAPQGTNASGFPALRRDESGLTHKADSESGFPPPTYDSIYGPPPSYEDTLVQVLIEGYNGSARVMVLPRRSIASAESTENVEIPRLPPGLSTSAPELRRDESIV